MAPVKPARVRIRDATAAETAVLEAVQRRSSDVWEAYRDQLAAHPDAIELPRTFIESGWVRVAVEDSDTPMGFSVVIPTDDHYELDGLFVEPGWMYRGLGRALVQDAVARASASGAARLEVTAGPAQGFYEKVGFHCRRSGRHPLRPGRAHATRPLDLGSSREQAAAGTKPGTFAPAAK